LPRQAGDSLPGSGLGRIVSLTDRVDSLVGLFSAGEEPSGDRDPYALRRAALGIIRILIEKRIDLDITTLIDMSVDAYQQTDCPIEQEAPMRVSDFLVERYRALYLAAGFRNDEITAVTQTGATHPLDFDRRLKAVARFRRMRAAASLAGANKRIRNILRRVDQDVPLQFNDSLFEHQAERDLAAALVRISTAVWPLIERSDYTRALKQLAGLGEPVDRFFDDVMVMAENPDQRSNRLALLNQLASLFLAIADISHLQPTD
jgi:glycyl-tRNA synthetase beta chain